MPVKPEFVPGTGSIKALCPDCGVPTAFEWRSMTSTGYGQVIIDETHSVSGQSYARTFYTLYCCPVCRRPAVAKFHVNNSFLTESLFEWFWPTGTKSQPLPAEVPNGVVAEYREAEQCMGATAWRAAAALLRSALEKVLRANGYDETNLYKKIEAAGADGVITSARRQRAQDLVRVLGNDVLHDDWRQVTQDEADDAYHYVGRIIEDLYDERTTVEKVLTSAGRKFLPAVAPPITP